jgi:purine-binding chemotaxis protein CheW
MQDNGSHQLTTFTLDGGLYGVEVEMVQEVIRYQPTTAVPLAPGTVAGLINLRGEVVTAIDLRERLGLPARPADTDPMNVVVRVGDEPVSLLVDVIGDVVEVCADDFEPQPETVSGVARALLRGAYKLEGRLLHALDVEKVVDLVAAAA